MKNNRTTNDIPASCQNKYRTVSIRSDLPKISKDYKEESHRQFPPNDFWMKKLDPSYAKQTHTSFKDESPTAKRYEIQYTIVNGSYTSDGGCHPILTAFLRAYNSHEDIVLSPDDMWLMICIYFSKYVNNNAEQLRHLFFNDQNTNVLTIEEEEIIEPNWNNFLEQVRLQMSKYVKNDLCILLTNNFSTTTKTKSLLSSLALMSTFKKSVDYTYYMTSCGIRNVQFLGTLDDWILLQEKTKQLQSFTIDKDDFFMYIDGILPILDQFIQTYQGNVDNQFWDQIFDLKHAKDESSQSDGMYMNGWFLQLCYGNHTEEKCLMANIGLNSLIVPVQLENELTNTSKICYLAGGFHGIQSRNDRHKPVSNLTIMDDLISITTLEK